MFAANDVRQFTPVQPASGADHGEDSVDPAPITSSARPGAGTGRRPPYRLRWIVAAVVLAANVMDLLDATIVNVAAPSIHRDLGGGVSTIQWLSAGYTLAFAVLLIAGARLGDIFGRRRLFLVGSAGFTLTSAACAVAPTIGVLITFRALQGAFGALMIPQGFGLMKEVFDDDAELDKALGLFGPATGVPMLAAPIIAGALIDANLWGLGWRLVFLINVPIGALALPLGVRSLPRGGATHPGAKLDIGGVLLVGLALVAIIYPLIQGRADGWPAWSFALLAVGAILLMVFLRYERHHQNNPLIEPTLLTNRRYLGGVAVALALVGARTASSWDLVAGLFFVGSGVGVSIGQLFRFILSSVTMDEVGSASGVMEAVQQLWTSLGVAVLGTIFFSAFGHHPATYALQIAAWTCLAPLAAAFVLVFRLPMQPREEQAH
jgi:MFS family permease